MHSQPYHNVLPLVKILFCCSKNGQITVILFADWSKYCSSSSNVSTIFLSIYTKYTITNAKTTDVTAIPIMLSHFDRFPSFFALFKSPFLELRRDRSETTTAIGPNRGLNGITWKSTNIDDNRGGDDEEEEDNDDDAVDYDIYDDYDAF